MQLFGTKGLMFLHCPRTKGQWNKLKILPWDGPGGTWDRRKKREKNSDCPVLGPVPDFDRLSRSVPACGKILNLSHCPFVREKGRNFCTFVPKSCTSRPVGNPKGHLISKANCQAIVSPKKRTKGV